MIVSYEIKQWWMCQSHNSSMVSLFLISVKVVQKDQINLSIS